MTFSPDSQQIITSDGNSLVLREVATGNALPPNPLVAIGTMPDWSADGPRSSSRRRKTATALRAARPASRRAA